MRRSANNPATDSLIVAGAAVGGGLIFLTAILLFAIFWKDSRPAAQGQPAKPVPVERVKPVRKEQPASVTIEKAGPTNGGKLFLRLKVSHSDPRRHVRFNGWTGDDDARIVDDIGNVYHHYVHFDRFLDVPGPYGLTVAAGECTINSNKPAYDCLVFEPPVPAAKKLTLELPASHFGGEGVVRLEIRDWR